MSNITHFFPVKKKARSDDSSAPTSTGTGTTETSQPVSSSTSAARQVAAVPTTSGGGTGSGPMSEGDNTGTTSTRTGQPVGSSTSAARQVAASRSTSVASGGGAGSGPTSEQENISIAEDVSPSTVAAAASEKETSSSEDEGVVAKTVADMVQLKKQGPDPWDPAVRNKRRPMQSDPKWCADISKGRYLDERDDYPPRTYGKKKRPMQKQWLKEHPWLEYSTEDNSLYCYPCWLFATSDRDGTWI